MSTGRAVLAFEGIRDFGVVHHATGDQRPSDCAGAPETVVALCGRTVYRGLGVDFAPETDYGWSLGGMIFVSVCVPCRARIADEGRLRERPVPCAMCGAHISRFGPQPKAMTWNRNGLCDLHQPVKA